MQVSFTSGNRMLSGCFFDETRRGTGRRGVLFVHGYGSSQNGYQERARVVSRSLDALCLTFDLSGHGSDAANLNRYTAYDHLQDVLAAFDLLTSFDEVSLARVGVCGASYGAYLAALATASRAIKCLILRAPSLAKDMHFINQHPQSKRVPQAFDSIDALRRYAGEVLIVESERDEIIPKSHIGAYLAACSSVQYELIPHATHALTDPSWNEVFITAITNWFQRL
jgi:pimeloyl-ACP methyl ester carboxylesterase